MITVQLLPKQFELVGQGGVRGEWAGLEPFLVVEWTVVETGGLGMETGGMEEGCWLLLVWQHCCAGRTLKGKENICRYRLNGSSLCKYSWYHNML